MFDFDEQGQTPSSGGAAPNPVPGTPPSAPAQPAAPQPAPQPAAQAASQPAPQVGSQQVSQPEAPRPQAASTEGQAPVTEPPPATVPHPAIPEPTAPSSAPSGFDQLAAQKPTIKQRALSSAVEADQARMSSFQRAQLPTFQKVILIVIAVAVIAAFLGGGIWLYFALNPFENVSPVVEDTAQPTLETQETIENEIPLHERDTDQDGLLDIDETKYGTDPNNPDTDGDGFTDGGEVSSGFNPNGEGELE